MSDRVPLEQVVDKPEPQISSEGVSTEKEETSPNIAGQTPPPGEFTYFTDMKALSVLLGFDGTTFDGMRNEANNIYEWSKKQVNFGGETDPVFGIKRLITNLGVPSRGKDLLRRLSHWVALDRKTKEIERRKASI